MMAETLLSICPQTTINLHALRFRMKEQDEEFASHELGESE
jgi:hypothetical protein